MADSEISKNLKDLSIEDLRKESINYLTKGDRTTAKKIHEILVSRIQSEESPKSGTNEEGLSGPQPLAIEGEPRNKKERTLLVYVGVENDEIDLSYDLIKKIHLINNLYSNGNDESYSNVDELSGDVENIDKEYKSIMKYLESSKENGITKEYKEFTEFQKAILKFCKKEIEHLIKHIKTEIRINIEDISEAQKSLDSYIQYLTSRHGTSYLDDNKLSKPYNEISDTLKKLLGIEEYLNS